MQKSLFQYFKQDVSEVLLPEKFTFPFYYEPHQLSIIAATELQYYLENQTNFVHNFGLDENQNGLEIGKMFGVLVVQNKQNELGYLWAFSGKMAENNFLEHFVPPVYDTLKKDGFYKQGEKILNLYSQQIQQLESAEPYLLATKQLEQTIQQSQIDIATQKERIKFEKKHRDSIRNSTTFLSEKEKQELDFQLSEASKKESIILKKMTKYWTIKIAESQEIVSNFKTKIEDLKNERKNLSASLQNQLFENYTFVNKQLQTKSIGEIFSQNPPAGAGECAAPKLLQYAFLHQLKPIAMAEFWWGKSPKAEMKIHKHFYPACIGKCQPILHHMLHGITLEDNPFEHNFAQNKELPIIYEDDYLLAVNKPSEFLSVPGKQVQDSVQERIKKIHPNSLIVHRLDMSTSGVILIAKSMDIYVKLQSQFIKRTIKKQYIALLDGVLKKQNGTIDLPLRVDFNNRPYQMVCFENGKMAKTKWITIATSNNQTLVRFYPITGRTHQLRVHAAHSLGLNTPIVGDDLYGKKANRLHLHAESITFNHPVYNKPITITAEEDFFK